MFINLLEIKSIYSLFSLLRGDQKAPTPHTPPTYLLLSALCCCYRFQPQGKSSKLKYTYI
jgi:hypothetical protein